MCFLLAAITSYQKFSGLNNITYNLTVLEARNPKWVSQTKNQDIFRAVFPLETLGGNPFACLRST